MPIERFLWLLKRSPRGAVFNHSHPTGCRRRRLARGGASKKKHAVILSGAPRGVMWWRNARGVWGGAQSKDLAHLLPAGLPAEKALVRGPATACSPTDLPPLVPCAAASVPCAAIP